MHKFALVGVSWGLAIFGFLRLPVVEAHVLLPLTEWQGRMAMLVNGATALPVSVTLACSGADLLAMCLGAVLAYPVAWPRRLAGAAGGLIVVLVLNTARIATLGQAAGRAALFDVLHLYVWPAMLAIGVAGYVFVWTRAADRVPRPSSGAESTGHLVRLTGICIIVFVAASPLYLESTWVLAAAGVIARSAAAVLRFVEVPAMASGNVLMTPRGGFLVTQECISTPLIPVYIAAVLAYTQTWPRRIPALAAVVPIFMALGIARLLVVALPAAMAGSTLFLIHAFYQLLTGVLIVVAAALWRRQGRDAWRHGAAGVAVGAACLAVLMPMTSRVAAGAPFMDWQGATSLMPAFQLALFTALYVAVAGVRSLRPLAIGLFAIAGAQVALFGLLHMAGLLDLFAGRVREVRALAIAVPVLVMAAADRYLRSRG